MVARLNWSQKKTFSTISLEALREAVPKGPICFAFKFIQLILPPSSFDWYISIWHNDQDHKCAYHVNLSLLISTIFFRATPHFRHHNQHWKPMDQSNCQEEAKQVIALGKINTSIKFKFLNFNNIFIKTGWREYHASYYFPPFQIVSYFGIFRYIVFSF